MCCCGDCVWEAGAPFELRFGTKWVQCIVHAVDEARRVVCMALKVPNIGSAPMWLPFMRSVCGDGTSTHLTPPHLAPPLPMSPHVTSLTCAHHVCPESCIHDCREEYVRCLGFLNALSLSSDDIAPIGTHILARPAEAVVSSRVSRALHMYRGLCPLCRPKGSSCI